MAPPTREACPLRKRRIILALLIAPARANVKKPIKKRRLTPAKHRAVRLPKILPFMKSIGSDDRIFTQHLAGSGDEK
jgi:hypothetical protein